ncbi:TniB family NTP-binding protein [Pseudomonas syringae]|uniref:TniB family NTP-binding protein n=1 Tax=Pseudomonas syringae TaxID=317 RepID=UPI003F87D86E
MTEFAHLHADFRPVLLLSDRERIQFLGQSRWIGYKSAHTVLDSLESLLEAPKRSRMPNLLIVGESNNGKTTIIKQFEKVHGKGYVDEDDEPVRPVIVAEAPPSAQEKDLYASILEQLWMPYRTTDSTLTLRYQVIHGLRELKVRMLIIDELHSMLTGTASKQREVMNTLKMLCNSLVIPIVGVGTVDAVQILHLDPQHASRFDVIKLENWKLNPDFQRLLKAFEAVLPLKRPSGLFKPEIAQLIHSISGGNTGNVHDLLVECAKEAITSGKECIDREIIEDRSWMRPTRGIRERAV